MEAEIVKPELIVPDTAPLIHLAAVGRLPLLNAVGDVVLIDMVVHEATNDPAKPFASEIADWISAGTQPGSNLPVRIAITEFGETFRKARLADPKHRAPGAGERAMLDWLSEEVEGSAQSVMVVYENGKVPDIIRRNVSDMDVAVLTTRAFLNYAQAKGLLENADSVWEAMVAAVPTVNPKDQTFINRRISEE